MLVEVMRLAWRCWVRTLTWLKELTSLIMTMLAVVVEVIRPWPGVHRPQSVVIEAMEMALMISRMVMVFQRVLEDHQRRPRALWCFDVEVPPWLRVCDDGLLKTCFLWTE